MHYSIARLNDPWVGMTWKNFVLYFKLLNNTFVKFNKISGYFTIQNECHFWQADF